MRKMETVIVERSPLNLRKTASTASGILCRSGSFNDSTLRPSRIIRDLPSVHRQPPLLPLPSPARFASGSYPDRKVRPRGNLQKVKPSASVVPVDGGVAIPPAKRVWLVKEPLDGIEDDEEYLESVYSKSPPPSSLPLPRFALMRPAKGGRPDSSGAAAAGTGGGVDAGATQNIRLLLRL